MDSLKNKETELDSLMPIMCEQLAHGGDVTFSPKGTSMLPMLRQGKDTVTLSPLNGKLKKYDLPLYRRDNGQYVLHRIVGVGDTYTCIGDNQFQKEYGVRYDQMIGVVSAFSREGRIVKASDFSYRLYCRVWCLVRPIRYLYILGCGFLKRMLKKIFKK